MALSRIYVQGDSLVWQDANGEYSTVGGIPNPVPFGFSGQAAGRIWVSTNDNFLYYSDSTGQTRFVRGVFRGTGVTGSVYAVSHVCPTANAQAKELFWVNGNGRAYSVRSEGVTEPKVAQLTIYAIIDPDTAAGYVRADLSTPIQTEVTLTGLVVDAYGDGTCGGSVTDGAISGMDVTIPVGHLFATSSGIDLTDPPFIGSYIIRTGSMQINGVDRDQGSVFCLGEDQITILVDPSSVGVCVDVSAGDGVQGCSDVCVPGSSSPTSKCSTASGCICNPYPTQYNNITDQWEHVCYDPDAQGGGSTCVCADVDGTNLCSPDCPAAGFSCNNNQDCLTISQT